MSTQEHSYKAEASNPDVDEKVSTTVIAQTTSQTFSVDELAQQPLVTRKELWSYYCMCLRNRSRLLEGLERISSILQWRQQRGAYGMCSFVFAFSR